MKFQREMNKRLQLVYFPAVRWKDEQQAQAKPRVFLPFFPHQTTAIYQEKILLFNCIETGELTTNFFYFLNCTQTDITEFGRIT